MKKRLFLVRVIFWGVRKKKWILVGFDQNLINFIRFSQKVTFCHFLTKNAFFSILIIFSGFFRFELTMDSLFLHQNKHLTFLLFLEVF